VVLAVGGAGLGAVVGLGFEGVTVASLRAPGAGLTLAGNVTGMAGMYLAMVMVALAGRLPVLEKAVGLGALLQAHRRIGPWAVALIFAHAVLTTFGAARAAKSGPLAEVGTFVASYPDMLAALVGAGLLGMATGVSIRQVRRRLRPETWWAVHLYVYLALGLSFAHVIVLGPAFVGHPVIRAAWIGLWMLTVGGVLAFRLARPLVRSLRHSLVLERVIDEGGGAVSLVLSGRHLDRLVVRGGQFALWRVLRPGLWWQAHPYSFSAVPMAGRVRVTVRARGDHSGALGRLRPGTRFAFEGPYGVFVADARQHAQVLLVAGGIGVTAVRALLDDLPASARPLVVLRARQESELFLLEEVRARVAERRGHLVVAVGSRSDVPADASWLTRVAPDVRNRDVFVSGPPALVADVAAAARALGVRSEALHLEAYG
jgi:predicted ferric reductase